MFHIFAPKNIKLWVPNLLVLTLSHEDNNAKMYKFRRYYLLKGVIKDYHIMINGKNVYGQPIDSDTKRYKEIRKLITAQGEDYATGCLLDYDYIKIISN